MLCLQCQRYMGWTGMGRLGVNTSAPKRIWTDWKAANDACVAFDEPPAKADEGYRTEYILAAEHARIVAEKDAEIARLREALQYQVECRADAMLRRHMNAPEDPHVEVLCERYGYGAVMDAASRLWARNDSIGAFYIGGCIGLHDDNEARAALGDSDDL